jgi:hypothetical protein
MEGCKSIILAAKDWGPPKLMVEAEERDEQVVR